MSHKPAKDVDAGDQLHDLRVFISVAEAESVTLAAKQLNKAISAITRSIMELEKSMGVSLFERKPRGMLLNSYGKATLVRARRVREEIAQAREDLARLATKPATLSANAIDSVLFNGKKLNLLITLSELKSISVASSMLGMTQSGVSMALSRIETTLNQELFQRRVQGMVATEVTEHLVVRGRRVLSELRHLTSDISELTGALAGSVVIGALPLGRTFVIPNALAEAIRKHPAIRVTTIESPYEMLIAGLRSGTIDAVIGVLRDSDSSHGVNGEILFHDRLGILVRSGHPLANREAVSLKELKDEKWILPRSNSLGYPKLMAVFDDEHLPRPASSVETGDLGTMRQLLLNSDMIAVTSQHQFMYEIQSGLLKLLPIELPNTTRAVGLILRENTLLSPAAASLVQEIRAQAGKLVSCEPDVALKAERVRGKRAT